MTAGAVSIGPIGRLGRWTADLRSKADVVDYLEQKRRELPPLIDERR